MKGIQNPGVGCQTVKNKINSFQQTETIYQKTAYTDTENRDSGWIYDKSLNWQNESEKNEVGRVLELVLKI